MHVLSVDSLSTSLRDFSSSPLGAMRQRHPRTKVMAVGLCLQLSAFDFGCGIWLRPCLRLGLPCYNPGTLDEHQIRRSADAVKRIPRSPHPWPPQGIRPEDHVHCVRLSTWNNLKDLLTLRGVPGNSLIQNKVAGAKGQPFPAYLPDKVWTPG